MRRDSGEVAGYCLTNVSGTKQSWNWLDMSGNGVLADDVASEIGLARPYVPMPVALARDADWPGSTSATYEALWRADVIRQHPKIKVSIGYASTMTGTTGDVRVLVDGTAVGTVRSPTFGSPAIAIETVDVTAFGSHCTDHVLTVEARRTAGIGAIRCSVQGVWGVQS
jgi:hypothetical protein